MKLVDSIKKLSLPLLKKPKPRLALQVSQRFIRLLGNTEGRKSTFPPQEVIFEDGDENKKITVLKDLVNKFRIQGEGVITCIPATDGILKLYKYPSTINQKDLENAISWVIKRELAQIKEETVYDYFILRDDKILNVALVMARAESVNKLTDLIRSVGLRPEIVDYEILAIINYGIYHKLSIPFSTLYIDYDYSILLTYNTSNLGYSVIHWSYWEYSKNKNEELLESFFAEVRNLIVINDISNIYAAGPALANESFLERLLENLPVLGFLDAGELPPNFFIPYILSIREK